MGLKAVASTSLASATLSDPTITGTVTAPEVVGIERVVASWGVPVALASSGTMGNNGAASAMTAMPTIYSAGIWLYIPAGAIAAGEPATAAYRWFKGSSTTAGTFYNSSWDGTGVPPLGTDTAYATTGPGAFTGVAAGEIAAGSVSIGAADIGANGALTIDAIATINTAAGNKIFRIDLGGTDIFSQTAATNTSGLVHVVAFNGGAANRQKIAALWANGASLVTAAPTYASVDTSGATTLSFTLEKNTATNHAIWEGATVKIAYAP